MVIHFREKLIYKTAYDLGSNYINIMESIEPKLNNPAVMFDIDDTLIDYNGNPIKPIIRLLNKCESLGYIILIITARMENTRQFTMNQLNSFGIYPDYLFLQQPGDSNHFKSEIKDKLAKESEIFTIMSIGDNWIDVEGPSSGYYLKLPNHYFMDSGEIAVNDPYLYHLNTLGQKEIIKC